MLLESLQKLYDRDLNKLTEEIQLYKDEKNLWITDKNISNSAGNLILHLIGNLNTYIGAAFGNTGYIRQRDLEFSDKNITKENLLASIEEIKNIIRNTLSNIPEEQLYEEYPMEVSYGRTSTYHYLIHINVHLSYHLGQINYHRRFFDE
jgi:hypothetical protein